MATQFDIATQALVRPGDSSITLTSPNKTSSTQSDYTTKLASLAPGDWLRVSGVTFSGEISFNKVMPTNGWARVQFDSTCKFTGTASGSNLPSLWVQNGEYIQLIFGPWPTSSAACCHITNTGGTGVAIYKGNFLVMDGFYVHDCYGGGLAAEPVTGPITNSFFRGEVYNIALSVAQDPHIENGTGTHCMLTADTGNYVFHDNKVIVFGHDCTLGGSVVETGDPSIQPYNNEFWLKGYNMLQDATIQVAANVLNIWGSALHDNTFHVVEGNTCHGRGVDCQGLVSAGHPAGANNVVVYGRADNCCLNPNLSSTESGVSPTNPWDNRSGIIYQDIGTNIGGTTSVLAPAGAGGGGGGGSGGAGTFGRSSIGSSFTLIGNGFLDGYTIQAPADIGSITQLLAYIKGGPSAQKVRAVIYHSTSTGPTPGVSTVLATGTEVTIASGQNAAWIALPFSAPVAGIAAGDWIMLGYWGGATDSQAAIAYDASDTSYWAQIVYSTSSAPTSPYPSTSIGSSSGIGVSLYAVYTPTVLADTTPPHLLEGQGEGGGITLAFNEAFDQTSVPAGSAFTVKRNSVADSSPISVQLQGQNVLLGLSSLVALTDTITVAYTQPGSGKLRDVALNNVVTFGDTAIVNVTQRIAGSGRIIGAGRVASPGNRIAGLGGGGI